MQKVALNNSTVRLRPTGAVNQFARPHHDHASAPRKRKFVVRDRYIACPARDKDAAAVDAVEVAANHRGVGGVLNEHGAATVCALITATWGFIRRQDISGCMTDPQVCHCDAGGGLCRAAANNPDDSLTNSTCSDETASLQKEW